jgi:signal transduction histidine kinase
VNSQDQDFSHDLQVISAISAIPAILDVICRTTGMGYATVARVTEDRWIACAVLDNIDFGLAPGGELKVETTLCHEVNQYKKAIVIDNFAEDPDYANHHTPAMYGLQSYISIPIILKDGRFFGTLCAIDPRPARVNNPETIGMFNLYAELIAMHLHNFEQLEISQLNLLEEKKVAELREQFIAILGHDLRNPVGAVKNVAQLMQSGKLDEMGIQRFAGVLRNSSQRMIGLIDNLMDFARGRLGSGIILHPVNESLAAPLRHVIEELQLIYPDSRIDTHFDLNEPLYCDTKRIAQSFSNLLGNALSHGTPGRPVTVRAASGTSGLSLSIHNFGRSIPEEVLEQIFEPFTRGAGDADHEGLGLGLYISSEIARAHGGTLRAASAEGEIIFTLTVPGVN